MQSSHNAPIPSAVDVIGVVLVMIGVAVDMRCALAGKAKYETGQLRDSITVWRRSIFGDYRLLLEYGPSW
jgi:hypothetical protein